MIPTRHDPMSEIPTPTSSREETPPVGTVLRQYAGIAVVALAYLGGIVGWTWAVVHVAP